MKKHISIPDARKQLRKWAKEWGKPELEELADSMYRRTPDYPRAKAERGSLTRDLAIKIRNFKRKNPEMCNRDIGLIFDVDGGRVSEAIHRTKGF